MSDRYSLNRRDKKLAGVCSTIGDVFNIDPTFVRLGFVAAAIFISWKIALIAYIGDVNDRRMMAIDHHLNSQNDELAREIEALREQK